MAQRTRRNFSITWGLDDEAARALDDKLDLLQNVYFGGTRSRNELLLYLFQFGLNFHWSRAKQGKGPTDEDRVEIDGLPEVSVVNDMIEGLRKKQQVIDQLLEVYESVGLDTFVEECEKFGIDWEGVLDGKYTFYKKPETWTARAMRFLDVLLEDGEPHPIAEIRQRAEAMELVGSDTDWNKMKVLASRNNLSGPGSGHGFWKRVR
jgi:hypothetical protein